MSAFDSLTDQINGLLQVDPSWKSIPGGLSKVSTSSLGFSWGISSQQLYYCRLPCSGEWTNVPMTDSPLDVVTDDNNVYVLGATSFMFKVASNMEDWVVVSAPAGAISILSTSSNIWAQDAGGKKWRLAKPGTTGNWVSVDDTSGTMMTSASGSSLYGIQGGKAVTSDESLQSGWSPLSEIQEPMSKVIGNLDKTAIYGVDTKNSLSRCASGSCQPVDIPAPVQNMTIDPKGNLWLTTITQGLKGNVYTKPDSLALPDTSELDKQRHAVVHEAEVNHQQGSLEKTLKQISDFLQSLLKKPTKDTSHVEATIVRNKESIDQLQKIVPALLRILGYISGVAIIYLFVDHWISHVLAILVLGVGVYDVYLSGKQ